MMMRPAVCADSNTWSAITACSIIQAQGYTQNEWMNGCMVKKRTLLESEVSTDGSRLFLKYQGSHAVLKYLKMKGIFFLAPVLIL